MSTNQDPNVQQVMYQQAGYAGYQTTGSNNVGTWTQPQPQAVHYPVQFHGDVNAYAEKNAYSTQYNPVQYAEPMGDGDYYRTRYATGTPYSHAQPTAQWSQQPAYQNTAGYAGQQQVYGTYAGTDQREAVRGPAFNPGAPPPNMNRPPPIIKRENGDNTFHASLSILENPAQTAAAYTASWVSSTSSIPPDLKDEPEYGNLQREDLGMFSSNFTDQFNSMGLHDNYKAHRDMTPWDTKPILHSQQWPGLGQQVRISFDDAGRNKKHDRDRRPREDTRELTWDERLRKAQVHKERVEQVINGEKNERERFEQNGRNRGSIRGRGGRAGFRGMDNRENRPRDIDNNRYPQNGMNDAQNRGGFRGRAGMTNGRGGMGHPVVSNMNPAMFQGQPSVLFSRGPPFIPPPHPPPPHLMNVPQDERFKNTWLDANAFYQPFPMPFAPMPYGVDNRFMGRGRGFGGVHRGGKNNFGNRNVKRDDEKKANDDNSVAGDVVEDKSQEHQKDDNNKNIEADESSKKENVEASS